MRKTKRTRNIRWLFRFSASLLIVRHGFNEWIWSVSRFSAECRLSSYRPRKPNEPLLHESGRTSCPETPARPRCAAPLAVLGHLVAANRGTTTRPRVRRAQQPSDSKQGPERPCTSPFVNPWRGSTHAASHDSTRGFSCVWVAGPRRICK